MTDLLLKVETFVLHLFKDKLSVYMYTIISIILKELSKMLNF